MEKLVTVTTKTLTTTLSAYENIEFLYPLKGFCVGYELLFDINQINGYVFINKILDDNDIKNLKTILNTTNNIKGVLFDDLGLIEVLKNKQCKKILLLNHYANNYESINYYLDYVDSVVISNDITKDEIINILANAKKKLVINVFGLNQLMYSRRSLLTNYNKHYNKGILTKQVANINDKSFIFYEDANGTVIYSNKYYANFELSNEKNVLFYWYNPLFLDDDTIKDVIINGNLNAIEYDSGFLFRKSIYKLNVGDKND